MKDVIPIRETLESYLDHPDRSEFIREMSDLYINVRDHLKVCDLIAKEQFGKDYEPFFMLSISDIVLNFMNPGIPIFEGEPIKDDQPV